MLNDSKRLGQGGRFEVVSLLGSGGRGTVFPVLDRERGTRLALKTVGSVDGDMLPRFKREFRALQDLQWLDDDSRSLLGQVLREPQPPSLLFVGTVRTSMSATEESDGPQASDPQGRARGPSRSVRRAALTRRAHSQRQHKRLLRGL